MRHALTALAFALPLPALAQDPATVGAMSGTLDGIQVSYVIADGEGADTSWQETDEGIAVSLTAYPSDSPMDDANEVTFTFIADTASRNPELLRGEMALNRDGETLTATDEAINLDLDNLEVSGDSLVLTGNIRATLSAGEEDVTVVAEEGTTLSADLQATILRTDDSDSASGS
ncbi:hypothetical protein SAMN04488020_104248 [Palleronia marisminoris]|uniref:Uncharacterized protein n=1 Tax=Palleronia marisminoris TaxID=315423 RepID=A0A1Y5SQD5_9RHOB|nr:hypothetical protein [Palleronia marisminoris]SFG87084.1 hypothetical protein SAMN04488020_104248 [Palleronia marisminoris]SLN42955.1 hypothetical protein PAM7066_01871 [Palleronia marisminoris]